MSSIDENDNSGRAKGNKIEIIDSTRPEYKNDIDLVDNKINDKVSKKYKQHSIEITGRKFYKRVGRTLFLFLDKYGNPLIIIGPHWVMYVCFCGIISFLFFLIYYAFWDKFGIYMKILGYLCFFTYFLSYSYTSLANPGYPKNTLSRQLGYPRKDYYFCEYCKFYIRKLSFASHCFDCNICIENHDHHCPWTGHCIGKNNLISFYIFLGSTLAIIIYLVFGLVVGASQL